MGARREARDELAVLEENDVAGEVVAAVHGAHVLADVPLPLGGARAQRALELALAERVLRAAPRQLPQVGQLGGAGRGRARRARRQRGGLARVAQCYARENVRLDRR